MIPELPPLDVAGRAPTVRRLLAEQEAACPALLVTDLVGVRWLTGFTGSAGRAVVLPDAIVLVVDGRYGDQARAQVADAGVEADVRVGLTQAELRDHLAGAVASLDRLGIEAESVSLAEHGRLEESLAPALVPLSGVVEEGRRTKDAGEVARIEAAGAVASAALAEVLARLEGSDERTFQLALDRAMEDLGAEGPSFATIVAAGPNAALPHHRPGRRRIAAGDTVVIDFGALVDGYHSDMTRTAFVGGATPRQAEVEAVVREAQQAGVDAVAPGVRTEDLDALVRDRITAAGWGEWFTHGTGHGVGLQIHEAPWITRSHQGVLRVGDVVTVEPGVYRSDFGGVRIEDTVVVTPSGCRPLTHTPKDLSCLPSRPTTSRPG